MYYLVETSKTFDQAVSAVEAAVVQNGFGVLHIHNLGETLRKKGVDFANECKVFEVCNPMQAAKVLSVDMRLNMALPCRISVFTENGKTSIGFIKPVPMLAALSNDETLVAVANEVEQKMMHMVTDASE